MNIDPERNVTIILPFSMIMALVQAKPILSMFSDEDEVKQIIRIIDALQASAMEYIRQEDGEVLDYLAGDTKSDDFDLLDDQSESDDEFNGEK
ncbi:hypothetical protein KAU08_05060 [bacterium]|nr:hypothetical protein [bacterium]